VNPTAPLVPHPGLLETQPIASGPWPDLGLADESWM